MSFTVNLDRNGIFAIDLDHCDMSPDPELPGAMIADLQGLVRGELLLYRFRPGFTHRGRFEHLAGGALFLLLTGQVTLNGVEYTAPSYLVLNQFVEVHTITSDAGALLLVWRRNP
jgi:hypothetical protein